MQQVTQNPLINPAVSGVPAKTRDAQADDDEGENRFLRGARATGGSLVRAQIQTLQTVNSIKRNSRYIFFGGLVTTTLCIIQLLLVILGTEVSKETVADKSHEGGSVLADKSSGKVMQTEKYETALELSVRDWSTFNRLEAITYSNSMSAAKHQVDGWEVIVCTDAVLDGPYGDFCSYDNNLYLIFTARGVFAAVGQTENFPIKFYPLDSGRQGIFGYIEDMDLENTKRRRSLLSDNSHDRSLLSNNDNSGSSGGSSSAGPAACATTTADVFDADNKWNCLLDNCSGHCSGSGTWSSCTCKATCASKSSTTCPPYQSPLALMGKLLKDYSLPTQSPCDYLTYQHTSKANNLLTASGVSTSTNWDTHWNSKRDDFIKVFVQDICGSGVYRSTYVNVYDPVGRKHSGDFWNQLGAVSDNWALSGLELLTTEEALCCCDDTLDWKTWTTDSDSDSDHKANDGTTFHHCKVSTWPNGGSNCPLGGMSNCMSVYGKLYTKYACTLRSDFGPNDDKYGIQCVRHKWGGSDWVGFEDNYSKVRQTWCYDNLFEDNFSGNRVANSAYVGVCDHSLANSGDGPCQEINIANAIIPDKFFDDFNTFRGTSSHASAWWKSGYSWGSATSSTFTGSVPDQAIVEWCYMQETNTIPCTGSVASVTMANTQNLPTLQTGSTYAAANKAACGCASGDSATQCIAKQDDAICAAPPVSGIDDEKKLVCLAGINCGGECSDPKSSNWADCECKATCAHKNNCPAFSSPLDNVVSLTGTNPCYFMAQEGLLDSGPQSGGLSYANGLSSGTYKFLNKVVKDICGDTCSWDNTHGVARDEEGIKCTAGGNSYSPSVTTECYNNAKIAPYAGGSGTVTYAYTSAGSNSGSKAVLSGSIDLYMPTPSRSLNLPKISDDFWLDHKNSVDQLGDLFNANVYKTDPDGAGTSNWKEGLGWPLKAKPITWDHAFYEWCNMHVTNALPCTGLFALKGMQHNTYGSVWKSSCGCQSSDTPQACVGYIDSDSDMASDSSYKLSFWQDRFERIDSDSLQ
jgi:hypothetical protein